MRIFAALCLLIIVSASGATFYVSPTGSDSADGSIGTPFLTLTKARNAMSSGDTAYLRGGNYYLTSAFTLGYTNSGTTFRAYSNEVPVIYGGLKITNWNTFSGATLVTDVSTQGVTGVFRQLIYNDERQPMARKPNKTADIHNGWSYVQTGGSSTSFTYAAGDIGTYTDIGHAEIMAFATYGWRGYLVPVQSINTGTRVVTTSTAVWPSFAANDRYYIQGVREELDAAGEWWLDSTNKYLYFWPPSAGASVYVPVVSNLVTIASGSSNITLRGLTITCCAGNAITMTGATNCLIAGNKIRNLGEYEGCGIYMTGGFTNGVVGNDISHVGANGIYISGGTELTLTPANHYADNNWVDYPGEYNKGNAGIWLEGVGNRASRNKVSYGTQIGIRFTGQNHLILSNEVANVMFNSDDGGGIYVYQDADMDWLSGRGCKVIGNYVHDVRGYGFQTSGIGIENRGIYLDGLTCGVDVCSNIVVHCDAAGLFVNGGSDNHFTNNVVVDCGHRYVVGYGNQTVYLTGSYTNVGSDWQARVSGFNTGYYTVNGQPAWASMRGMDVAPTNHYYGVNGATMWSNMFFGNVIVYTNSATGTNSTYDFCQNLYKGAPEQNPFDKNALWHYTGWPVQNKSTSVTKEWPDWQALGLDVNSITNNPLVNASTDFSLAAESPARALGIASLSTATVGPYSSTDRATWPLGTTVKSATIGTVNAGTFNLGQ